jgi:hypothetical protein
MKAKAVFPDLIRWHEDPSVALDLRDFAGFDSDYTNRPRPEVVADSGTIDSSDIDEYISSRGSSGKTFKIYCMSDGTMQNKLDVAIDQGKQLGLRFTWQKDELLITDSTSVHLDDKVDATIPQFLVSTANRQCINLVGSKSPPEGTFVCPYQTFPGALQDLCTVVAVAISPYKTPNRSTKCNTVAFSASTS